MSFLIQAPRLLMFKSGGGIPYLEFTAANGDEVLIGSNAALDDLHDAAFTVEGWVMHYNTQANNAFFGKGHNAGGWICYTSTQGTALGYINGATTDGQNAASLSVETWHHLAMTFDDGGDRVIRMYVDGVQDEAEAASIDGAVVADTALDFYLGRFPSLAANSLRLDGRLGWIRVSDSIRYSANFTPPGRGAYPAVDGNTVAQWNMDEGEGSTIDNIEGTADMDGAITGAVWGRG